MANLKELRNERLRKLSDIKKLNLQPYPAKSGRTNTISEIIDKFSEFESKNVIVSGRIISTRKFGKIAFLYYAILLPKYSCS